MFGVYQQAKRRFQLLRRYELKYSLPSGYTLFSFNFFKRKKKRNIWGFDWFFKFLFIQLDRNNDFFYNNYFDVKVYKEKDDVDGSYLMLKFTTEEKGFSSVFHMDQLLIT